MPGRRALRQDVQQKYFELRPGAHRDSAEFSCAVDLIRRGLEHSGFYLTARRQAGNGYAIAEPEALGDILMRKERRGSDEFCGRSSWKSNANLNLLTEAQHRRTETILSRVAQREALASRKLPRELPGGDDEAAAAA